MNSLLKKKLYLLTTKIKSVRSAVLRGRPTPYIALILSRLDKVNGPHEEEAQGP